MTKHSKKIDVQGTNINIFEDNVGDFLSLTDMLKAKDGDFFISDWLRNRNTVEFLGIWEKVHNPDFNYGEFAIIRSQAGLNSYKISVKKWVRKTSAVGLRSKAGRYCGTYVHKDIAFVFGYAGNAVLILYGDEIESGIDDAVDSIWENMYPMLQDMANPNTYINLSR